ncbi:predicted protein [Phaeodactylum tricornutum CCAP 1055/1]|jgi:hypothetical protein|uniref:Uncharacterized protein n=2 Tax=Phaeodactylum tricornutum TaxID=2850 RepID=B7GB39_PHATC|nr:predicted protein [Phaeodactylum tricornutum CCAP 1055/1]EEC44145.1 predicted protein [Phaeodactylum tricornutum CCAP 1055/1]|eukprot:XP_002184396.1 predicted protein [Phaeodactylum tricornutum CCAP 1055/1]
MYRPRGATNSSTASRSNGALDKDLDASLHSQSHHGQRPARRRSSLDNSCLAAPETFREYLFDIGQDDKDLERGPRERRRLSLNNRTSTTTIFLAGSPSTHRPKIDLDKDWHDSFHSKTPTDLLSSHHDSATSWDSDEDSFCDATEEEPANREYLRRDLGASCRWSDDGSEDFDFEDEEDVNVGPGRHLMSRSTSSRRASRRPRRPIGPAETAALTKSI